MPLGKSLESTVALSLNEFSKVYCMSSWALPVVVIALSIASQSCGHSRSSFENEKIQADYCTGNAYSFDKIAQTSSLARSDLVAACSDTSAVFLFIKGLDSLEQGDVSAAETSFNSLLVISTKTAATISRVLLAESLLRQKKFEKAEEILSEGLAATEFIGKTASSNPKWAEIQWRWLALHHLYRGRALLEIDLMRVRDALLPLDKQRGVSAEVLQKAGLLLREASRRSLAVQGEATGYFDLIKKSDVQRLVTLAAEAPPLQRLQIASALFPIAASEAEAILQSVWEANPLEYESLHMVASSAARRQQNHHALKFVRLAAERNPFDKDVAHSYCELLLASSRINETRIATKRYLKMVEGDDAIRLAWAAAEIRSHRGDLAEDILNTSRSKNTIAYMTTRVGALRQQLKSIDNNRNDQIRSERDELDSRLKNALELLAEEAPEHPLVMQAKKNNDL